MDASISVAHIEEAASLIDPVFLNSPQFENASISDRLGVLTVLKVETVNPIRNFKGRGADYLLHRLGKDVRPIVCATAGNFGQGMAYACRKRGVRITVFVPNTANFMKIQRMQGLGAKIERVAGDFDEAKDAARRHAETNGELFIEDGLVGAIAEGAGTIARELTTAYQSLDAVFVPLGNGSLVNGIGTWLKHRSPKTMVVGVCARDSPSMAISYESGKPISAPSTSVADGIAVRVPVPEAVAAMSKTVDEVMLVADEEMFEWMRPLHADAGLVIEPSGAASLAGIAKSRGHRKFRRAAAILTGGNVNEAQMKWLYERVKPVGPDTPRSRSAR